jgi:hypothetical protein
MSSLTSSPLLKRVLLVDGLTSLTLGVLLMVAAGVAGKALGLPEGLLRAAGLICLPFGAGVLWLARQGRPPEAAIWAVIAANGGWVAASIVLLVSGWVSPTMLGLVVVIAQAVIVGLFAELQYVGWRRVHQPMHGQPANS